MSGRVKGAARAALLAAVASGEVQIAIGTHALFQKDVEFADLGLAALEAFQEFARGFRGFSGFGSYGFWPYDDYGYGYSYDNCYQTQQYHTRTGWHTRQVYVCD